MKIENLEHYLTIYETLCPSDNDVGVDVTSTDWWLPLKTNFDDLIWLYFGTRMTFAGERYSSNIESSNVANIRKAFAIWIKSKKRLIDRLYEGYMADFNPLWNVDGMTGHVSKDSHTGDITDKHTGDDRMTYEDNGNIEYQGTETDTLSGTDTVENANTTYESGNTFYPESTSGTTYGKTNTHSRTGRKDVRDYDGFKNQNFNSTLKKTNDLLDEHVDLEIRQGNIGVTKSTDLLEDNQLLYMNEFMDLYKWIVRMCVNQVSYSVEGVI